MADPDAMMRGTLGDFFSISREKGSEGLPTLSVTMYDGLVRRDSIDRKTDSELEEGEHLRVRPGDIAYNMMRMWQGASGLATEDGIVSPAYVVVRPKKTIDPLFASYWFKSERMIYLFWAYSYGLTNDRLRLYAKDFTQIPVEVPPLHQQRKIAEILSDFDRSIEFIGTLAVAKEKRKQGLMQQLFNDGPQTELSKVAKISFSGVDKKINLGETPVKLCNYTDVYNSARIEGDLPFMEATASQAEIARFTLKAGDVLFTKDSEAADDIAASAYVPNDLPGVICGYHLALARAKPKLIDGRFLAYSLRTPEVRNQFRKLANGVTRFGLNMDAFDHARIRVPDLSRQHLVSEALHDCDLELEALDRQRNLLRQQQRGVRQTLLGGTVNASHELLEGVN